MRQIIFINLFRGPLAAFSKASQWDHSKSTRARTQQDIQFAFKSEKTYHIVCLYFLYFVFLSLYIYCLLGKLCLWLLYICFLWQNVSVFSVFFGDFHVGYKVIKVNCYFRFNPINYKIKFLHIYIQMPKNVCRNVLYATSR